jgi:hypothetical protein
MSQTVYYVKNPDDTYSIADPQPATVNRSDRAEFYFRCIDSELSKGPMRSINADTFFKTWDRRFAKLARSNS